MGALVVLAALLLAPGAALAAPEAGGPAAAPALAPGQVRLSVIYDNTSSDPAYRADWGFACLVETPEKRVLFDAGAQDAIWNANFAALGRDARSIDAFVLSHDHGDHTGGLAAFLRAAAAPALYLPPNFSSIADLGALTKGKRVDASGPVEVAPGIWTTGAVQAPAGFPEQALIVRTERGLVLLTGCSHPGVATLARRAKEVARDRGLAPPEIDLVIGGFHMLRDEPEKIQAAIDELKRLGVRKIAGSHCTGDKAMSMIAKAWGPDFVRIGAGTSLTIGSP